MLRLVAILLYMAVSALLLSATNESTRITFYRDVLPILQRRCQNCHRTGEIGPMPLLTYRDTRPWAAAIKEVVISRKMPPWFADAGHGSFSNDRSLSPSEIRTLVTWTTSGAMEGKRSDAPPQRGFVPGWNIGKPDLIVEMPSEFTVPASGVTEYIYIVMPLNLPEDKWVQMAEARPGNSSVVHHITAFIRNPESNWLRGEAQSGIPFIPRATSDGRVRNDTAGMGSEVLCFYVPGYDPQVFPPGSAKKVRAGSDLVLEMHYTPNGKQVRDRSKIGIIYSREPVNHGMIMATILAPSLLIPPGASDHQVDISFNVKSYGMLMSLYPHMHLRGKKFEFRVVYPGGKTETILHVSNYNFHWQLDYRLKNPIALTPGMKIECTAWYDNSSNNPDNPDPRRWVHVGPMSWDEMMAGVLQVAVDPRLTLQDWSEGRPVD